MECDSNFTLGQLYLIENSRQLSQVGEVQMIGNKEKNVISLKHNDFLDW